MLTPGDFEIAATRARSRRRSHGTRFRTWSEVLHPLRLAGRVQRLPNRHTLICNCPAHGHEGKQPLLVEVTGDKQGAWVFDGRDRLRRIIDPQLLDDIKVRP